MVLGMDVSDTGEARAGRRSGAWASGALSAWHLSKFTGKRHVGYTGNFQIRDIREVRKNRIHILK